MPTIPAMRIYVTGASGFVGSHVAAALRAAGGDVRTRRVELLDGAALERSLRGCEAVVHVAGLYSYDARPAELEAVNVEGTRRLLDAWCAVVAERAAAPAASSTSTG